MELRAAAMAFLSNTDLVAWESGHRGRMMSLLERMAGGHLADDGLRAASVAASRQSDGPSPSRSMAVLRLAGVLTPDQSFFSMIGLGTSIRSFMGALRDAARDPAITRISILVDSPGGSIGLLPEAAALMRSVRARKEITVAVSGLNASAAYWITSNATRIEATQSATLGSIGVYAVRASIVRQLDREGVDIEMFAAGKFKTEGSELTVLTDEERGARRAEVTEAYESFVSDVALGRGVSAATVRGGYGEGRVVSAREARRLGMIDGIDLVESTIARAAAAPDLTARGVAWQQEATRQLFALQLPASEAPLPASFKRQLEEAQLAIDVALL